MLNSSRERDVISRPLQYQISLALSAKCGD